MPDIVAENAQRIIRKKKLKQKEIAEKMGLPENQLSAIFCDRKKINTDIVLKFCKVLKVTPNELYGYK